jgi:predicted DNA-binding transcriptional regulator AlpA
MGVKKGTGPRYAKIGRHVRYRLSDVIDWGRKQFNEDKRSSA